LDRRERALAGLTVLWLLLRPPPVARAEEPPVITLPELVVQLPRAAPADPTSAATVIEASRFAGEPKDVAAIVATAPGVAVQEYGGLGQLSTISIRGAAADGVKVLIDGLQLNTESGAGVDLSTIPRGWVDRIEVIRGAEGARYGAGALGGVVNVVTRPGAAGEWSARASAGSFRTGSAAADAGFGGDGWGSLVAASLDGTGGRFPYRWNTHPSLAVPTWEDRLRSNNGTLSGGLLTKGWVRAGPSRLDWLALLSGSDRELAGPPGNETPGDRIRERRALAAARWSLPLAADLELTLGAEGRGEALDVAMAALGGTDRQLDAAASSRAELRWARGGHLVLAGISGGGERLDGGGLGAIRSRWSAAAWGSDEWLLAGGRLRIAPALRAERLGPFSGLSGKLGGSVALGGPVSTRASLGRTWRAPGFSELYLEQGPLKPNPDLRPEQALSADAALQADGRLGLASLGGFTSLYDDLIVYVPASLDRVKPVNDARAWVRGLEAEMASAPLGALGLTGQLSWTWMRAETLRGAPEVLHRDVPRRARQRLYARLGIAPGSWELHAEVHQVGRQWLDAANLAPIPAALAVHGGGSVRLWRGPEVWLHLDVKNVADDRTLQNGFGYPLPGRMVMVALRAASRAAPRNGGRQ
jgi:vitamin B12 transporter